MNRNTTIFASSLVLSISLVVSSVVISNAVSTPTIKACAAKKTGDLRMITGKAKCKKSEKPVSWGTKGPTGARGPSGVSGKPDVSTVSNFQLPWTSIYVANQSGWDTVSLMQSEPLAAGDYLVFTNLEIYTEAGGAFCATTTNANEVGGSGNYHTVPTEPSQQHFSFDNHLSVAEGERIHLRCAGNHADSEVVNAYMTLIPVS